jgi:hypothetical protein
MPTATDLVTDLPADFETFGQAVATSMADLLGGTTGQVLSKASNTNMDFTWVTSDDANAIQNAIVDAKGDLIAASAADTPARLAVGTNGQVLVADSSAATGIKWAATGNVAGCAVFGSTTSIVNNTVTVLNFANEFFDTNGFHSTTTNTNRFTVPAGFGGIYRISAACRWDLNGVNERQLTLRINGGVNYQAPSILGAAGAYVGNVINWTSTLSAGDYVDFTVFQNSGGNLNVFLDNTNANFSFVYLGGQ